MTMRAALCAIVASPFLAEALRFGEAASANPIRRSVTLLQNMGKELEAEGRKEETTYKKFMCFCTGNTKGMTAEAEAAAEHLKTVRSDIESLTGEKARVESELAEHKADREEAKTTVKTATVLREKELKAYNEAVAEEKANIDALNRAIPALEKGMGVAGFIQAAGTGADVARLRKLAMTSTASSKAEKAELMSFLSGSGSGSAGRPVEGYAPSSGQIVGILKSMLDQINADLGGVVEAEKTAAASHAALIAAKKAEIAAATTAVEAKTKRVGELGVSIAEAKNDVSDTSKGLEDNQAFMADLSVRCEDKTKEWEERSHTRAQELQAISEAVAILNDDDALDLFKKTLDTPREMPKAVGFLQKADRATCQARARKIVAAAAESALNPQSLNLLTMMLSAKTSQGKGPINFSKIIVMIEDMIKHLGKEQKDDDHHREFCTNEFHSTDMKTAALGTALNRANLSLEEATGEVKVLSEGIDTLKSELHELEKTVSTATEQRKEENREFVTEAAELSAAKQLIAKAVNRLHKFYNPKMYKAPTRVLTEEERVFENHMGAEGAEGEEKAVPAASFLQLRLRRGDKEKAAEAEAEAEAEAAPKADSKAEVKAKREPEPETWSGDYKSKSQKNTGVIALLKMLQDSLAKDLQEAKRDEASAKQSYEKLMLDAASTKQTNNEAITSKQQSKAELEGRVQEAKQEKAATLEEIEATKEQVANLHRSCDFLVENYDFRKAARASERENLVNAKAALHGAQEEPTPASVAKA